VYGLPTSWLSPAFDEKLNKTGDDTMKRCKHHCVGTPRIGLKS
jgi:hypothetical protein